MYSIRKQLTLVLVSVITLGVFSAAIEGYRSSMIIANQSFDDELALIAKGLVPIAVAWSYLKDNNALVEANSIKLPQNHSDNELNFAYQIIQQKNIIFRTDNAPEVAMAELENGFSDVYFSAKRWRLYISEYQPGHWVLVAQQRQQRNSFVSDMIVAAVKPIIWIMPILCVLILFIISKGLSPLKTLSKLLTRRQSTNLNAIELPNASIELQPVLTKLNELFSRLESSFEREREFVSHAAHELRTPLSVMKINIHNLATSPDDLSTDLPKLQRDVERMILAVNQLLSLSKTNPETLGKEFRKVNLFESAQNVISELYPAVELKHQQIELLGDSVIIQSQTFLIQTLISNLVSNAIKYTPNKGHISVRVEENSTHATLTVSDSGPGIPENLRKRVLERFYRTEEVIKRGIVGSGLGLAIVAQVAKVQGADLSFTESPVGGLEVRVAFPKSISEISSIEAQVK
ncbi:ATP-binding protein [Brumicola blandensis]|uniref:histidine kinase n=1 Tax=Brumicola blandensis TaxID=3075611 RepID=A0AAW8R3N3_9ALTE|nr:ATP-binding protein [Alteromonas sp. W409]MDT0583887.1 ATP-binding protein [Alteromonas sp. W409]